MGGLGWKTVTGAVFVGVGQALAKLPDPLGTVGNVMLIVGPILFGVGVRSAINKVNKFE